jgi:hypothetical protein
VQNIDAGKVTNSWQVKAQDKENDTADISGQQQQHTPTETPHLTR